MKFIDWKNPKVTEQFTNYRFGFEVAEEKSLQTNYENVKDDNDLAAEIAISSTTIDEAREKMNAAGISKEIRDAHLAAKTETEKQKITVKHGLTGGLIAATIIGTIAGFGIITANMKKENGSTKEATGITLENNYDNKLQTPLLVKEIEKHRNSIEGMVKLSVLDSERRYVKNELKKFEDAAYNVNTEWALKRTQAQISKLEAQEEDILNSKKSLEKALLQKYAFRAFSYSSITSTHSRYAESVDSTGVTLVFNTQKLGKSTVVYSDNGTPGLDMSDKIEVEVENINLFDKTTLEVKNAQQFAEAIINHYNDPANTSIVDLQNRNEKLRELRENAKDQLKFAGYLHTN